MTFPISGTGSAGMEFCFANLIEPGDEVAIGVNGVFGTRMADVATRCGAEVVKVGAEWGVLLSLRKYRGTQWPKTQSGGNCSR